ncbi:two-component system response regulator PilR (NtrC family) [Plasticicumulans lactativorans]|uniref:Two-component system response regulator PilR (NtrC family) n=1 Tax=Plasticicumulans lactativorans TaxID=1133106 RepID=A0A4R2KZQ8_9GAMM|nr:sigma-54 dependent transcriptional regulator [Plasticicumulans lactativorans]TCO80201.1 two-component system response regulator PilR (NtrC family) [Plasticicumulans lactativorans]
MDTCQALIVDDEEDIRTLIEMTLQPQGVRCDSAATLADAHRLLRTRPYQFCITDMRLPDGNGLELVAHVQRHHPDMPIAVITAHGNVESAVDALKLGAYDFVSKPFDIATLRSMVATARKLARPSDARSAAVPRQTLLGDSAAMQRVRSLIARLARSQAPVFISGESGTGKELAARLVHSSGPRADKPFVPVNCGAIPAELMESEFFGHRRGAFTGAVQDKAGLFQAADGGTLFLDEIAELPQHMQVKLLRAIQERAVKPVGATHEVPVDVRVLSASHRDLGRMIAEGGFRRDLYYRLNVIELHLPALRERPEDIPVLCEHLLARLAATAGLPCPHMHPQAIAALQRHPFPGNVRELENILERAFTLCDHDTIGPADLQPDPPPADAGTVRTAVPVSDLEGYLEGLEKEAIEQALRACRYNKTAAAERLGISFRALRYRLKKLGME